MHRRKTIMMMNSSTNSNQQDQQHHHRSSSSTARRRSTLVVLERWVVTMYMVTRFRFKCFLLLVVLTFALVTLLYRLQLEEQQVQQQQQNRHHHTAAQHYQHYYEIHKNNSSATPKNFHSRFPPVCGGAASTAAAAGNDDEVIIIENVVVDDPDDTISLGALYTRMEGLNGGGWAHMHVVQGNDVPLSQKLTKLVHLQTCMYDALQRWIQLAHQYNITRWSAIAGTMVGIRCYQSINPWDDDIDIMLSEKSCDILESIHQNLIFQPNLSFDKATTTGWVYDSRLLPDKKYILSKFYNVQDQLYWYKLKPYAQLTVVPTPDDTSGMDLLCVHSQTEQEMYAMEQSGFTNYLENNETVLNYVTFGPTIIQVVPMNLTDKYISTRYHNREPCNLHGLYYKNKLSRYGGYNVVEIIQQQQQPPSSKPNLTASTNKSNLRHNDVPDGGGSSRRRLLEEEKRLPHGSSSSSSSSHQHDIARRRSRRSVISITENLAVAFYDENTIRVFRTTASSPANAASRMIERESLVVIADDDDDPLAPSDYVFVERIVRDNDESNNIIQLKSRGGLIINVTYNNSDAMLSFWDSSGTYMYTQETGAYLLSSTSSIINDDDGHNNNKLVRQSWSLMREESLYGGGQYVNGLLDYSAAPIHWQQSNTEAVVPFVVSSRNYGILWDLYGDTWLNPPDNSHRLEFPTVIAPNQTVAGVFVPPRSGDYWFAIRTYNGDGPWHDWGDYTDTRLSIIAVDDDNDAAKTPHNVCEHVNLAAPPVVLTCKARNLQGGTTYLTVLEYKKWNGSFQNGPTVYYVSVDEHQYTTIQSHSSGYIDYYFLAPEVDNDNSIKRKGNIDKIHRNQEHFTSLDSVIASYRKMTGPSPLLSKKAFGFWQCKERYHNQTELLEAAKQFRLHGIPVDNIVQDWHYWGDYGWSPQWDRAIYPDPKLMVDKLHDEYHLSLMVSVWSKFNQKTKFYKELHRKKFLINGTVWFDAWNPAAQKTFYGYLKGALFSIGVDGVWLDATEPEGDPQINKTIFLGSGNEYLNTYSLMVTKSFYDGFIRDYPEKRPFALTRSSFAGQQRYAGAIWSGDTTASFESLRRQIAMSINYQASGMPYWTCDIGGFFRPEDQYSSDAYHLLLLRWFQFGVFNGLMRVHGEHSDTELWNYGGITQSLIVRSALDLRYRLLHYIYSGFRRVEQEGYTMGRAMIFDFPNDMYARDLSDQFMFGGSFLVAPIYSADSSRTFYLPRLPERGSVWRDFYSGSVLRPGLYKAKDVDRSSMLLFVRSSILVLAPIAQHVEDTSGAGALEVRIFAGTDSSFTLFEDDGKNPDPTRPTTSILFRWIEESSQLVIERLRGLAFLGMWRSRVIHVVLVRPEIGSGIDESSVADETVLYGGQEVTVNLHRAHKQVNLLSFPERHDYVALT